MHDYHLKTHIFSIKIGGCDIVIGFEWLQKCFPITIDFQEFYMLFKQNDHTRTLQGLQAGVPTIINSHRMEKVFKKGHHGVVSQFNSIDSILANIHPNMQQVLDHQQWVFYKSKELPLSRVEHDHSISLLLGTCCSSYNHPPKFFLSLFWSLLTNLRKHFVLLLQVLKLQCFPCTKAAYQ